MEEEYTTQEMLEDWFDCLTQKEVVRLWNGYCQHTGKHGDPELYKVFEMNDETIDSYFPQAHMLAENIRGGHWNYHDHWWHYKRDGSLESLEEPYDEIDEPELKEWACNPDNYEALLELSEQYGFDMYDESILE